MKGLFLGILASFFIITLIYTYGIIRLTEKKWVIFLPTILVLLVFSWYLLKNMTTASDDYAGLRLFFLSLHLIPIVLTNLFFGFIFLKGTKE